MIRTIVQLFLASTAWVVLPGLVGLIHSRRTRNWTESVTVGLLVAMATWLLPAALLAHIDRLNSTVLWLLTADLLIAELWYLGWWLPKQSWFRASTLRPTPGCLAVLGIVFLSCLPTAGVLAARGDVYNASTPWYYQAQVDEVVDQGGFPSGDVEFGEQVDFLIDYPAFTAGTAAFAILGDTPQRPTGRHALAASHLTEVLALVGILVGTALLARSLGAAPIASSLAVLLAASTALIGLKALSFRPEALAYTFALTVPVGFLACLRRPTRLAIVATIAGAITAALTHGIVFAFLTVVSVALVVRELAIRNDRPKTIRRATSLAGGIFGLWIVTIGSIKGLAYDTDRLQVPFEPTGIDPTWRFFALSQGVPIEHAPTAASLFEQALRRGIVGVPFPWVALVAIGVAVVVGVGVLTRDRPLIGLAAFGLTVTLALTAIAAVFGLSWNTYVPIRTGTFRLGQLVYLLFGPAVAAVVSNAPIPSRRWLMAGLAVFTLAVTTAAWPDLANADRDRPSPTQVALLTQLDLDADDVVLANAYTEGWVERTTGAQVLLSGRAPYTDPPLRTRANQLLAEARDFFNGGSDELLDREGVTVVIVALDFTLGTPRVFPVDFVRFADDPRYQLIANADAFSAYRYSG